MLSSYWLSGPRRSGSGDRYCTPMPLMANLASSARYKVSEQSYLSTVIDQVQSSRRRLSTRCGISSKILSRRWWDPRDYGLAQIDHLMLHCLIWQDSRRRFSVPPGIWQDDVRVRHRQVCGFHDSCEKCMRDTVPPLLEGDGSHRSGPRLWSQNV